VFRSLRALLLFWGLLAGYLWVYLQGRLFGGFEARLARAHARGARRLAEGFSELGGVFIKVGQVLSVVGTFLPKAYVEALETLQDKVRPRPFREVTRRLEAALGYQPLRRFRHIDRRPIAAASLAQVHRAISHDGRELAVKVLYPGIEEWIRSDLWVLRSLQPVVNWLIPITHSERILEQLETMLARETNLEHERTNLEKMRTLFAGRADIVVPSVERELTSGAVLTMSFEHGLKVNDTAGLEQAGILGVEVANKIVDCYVTMLLEHRLFHADPHPGNFLIRKEGGALTLVLLDFGAVETLSEDMAAGMRLVLEGALLGDDDKLLSGVATMGFVAEHGDRDLLRQAGHEYLEVFRSMNLTNLSGLNREHFEKLGGYAALRGKLREVMRNVQYPPGYFYVERTLVLLFGLIGKLAPEQGLVGLLLPRAARVLSRVYSKRLGRHAS
jgi:ubiquinone biosynthesis protein